MENPLFPNLRTQMFNKQKHHFLAYEVLIKLAVGFQEKRTKRNKRI